MTATLTTPADTPIDVTAGDDPTAETAGALRLRLQDDGWRTMVSASDPRRRAGTDGEEITISYHPEFAELGVPIAMFKTGDADADGSAVHVEKYRFDRGMWAPVG